MTLATNAGTFLKAARSVSISSGICCAAITSMVIAKANAASMNVSSRVISKLTFDLFFGAPSPRRAGCGRALTNRRLSHPERIERRLIDRRCRGEPVIGLIGGQRLARQRPEQPVYL